jgi:hypothetical protein
MGTAGDGGVSHGCCSPTSLQPGAMSSASGTPCLSPPFLDCHPPRLSPVTSSTLSPPQEQRRLCVRLAVCQRCPETVGSGRSAPSCSPRPPSRRDPAPGQCGGGGQAGPGPRGPGKAARGCVRGQGLGGGAGRGKEGAGRRPRPSPAVAPEIDPPPSSCGDRWGGSWGQE